MYQSRVSFRRGRERFLSAANCLTIIFSRRLVGIKPEDKSIVRVQVPARYSVGLANEPVTKWSNSQRTYKNSRRASSKKATDTNQLETLACVAHTLLGYLFLPEPLGIVRGEKACSNISASQSLWRAHLRLGFDVSIIAIARGGNLLTETPLWSLRQH